MSAFGPRAVEVLASMMWAYELRVLGVTAPPLDRCATSVRDRYRAEAATMLAQVGVANREHLTERIEVSLLRVDPDNDGLAGLVVREVYETGGEWKGSASDHTLAPVVPCVIPVVKWTPTREEPDEPA